MNGAELLQHPPPPPPLSNMTKLSLFLSLWQCPKLKQWLIKSLWPALVGGKGRKEGWGGGEEKESFWVGGRGGFLSSPSFFPAQSEQMFFVPA